MRPQIVAQLVPLRWGVSTALLILALTAGIKWHSSLMPDASAYPPAQPAPPVSNARDVYDQAEQTARDKPALQSAYYALCGIRSSDPKAVLPAPAEVQRIVAENLPALAMVRRGMQQPYCPPPVLSENTLIRYGIYDEYLAALLGLQAREFAAKGDWSGAIDSDIDAIRFGVSLQQNADMSGSIRGSSREAAGRRDAWRLVDHLTSAQAKAATNRMVRITTAEAPFSAALRRTRVIEQTVLLELFSHRGWRGDLGLRQNLMSLLAFTVPPRDVYTDDTRLIDEGIQRSELAWPRQKDYPLHFTNDPFALDSYPASIRLRQCVQNDADALDRMLLVELALRAYRLDRSKYPSTLDQLVPAYLPSVPKDPFSEAQPLRYQFAQGKPLLYSVGPDAIDNGGQPVRYPLPRPEYSSDYPVLDSKGDLMAGSG